MAKVGVPQGNPLAALGNILRKGQGRGSGRDSKSPRRESPLTKKSSFKESKESLRDGAKDSPELSRRTSEPKSPKTFRFGIRRSSSRSKKGDRDDTASSDTSSVNSFTAVPVKEVVPMEIESSGLSVSKSANANDEKAQDHLNASKATDTSTSGDASTTGNRISTYFKPHEVEALSDLFASGELDALLGTNDQPGDSLETMSGEDKAEGEGKKEEKAQEHVSGEDMLAVEHVSGGNELKRNHLHSSFRMYESRYKAETLERKKDKSSFSSSETTTVEKSSFDSDLKAPHSDEQHIPVATSTPEPTKSEGKALFDDDDNDKIAAATAAENKDEGSLSEEKQKKVKENERRRRKLFDDELFLSDVSTRSQVRKKVSATAPGLDAYAQAHKSPPPVITTAEKEDIASGKSLDNHLNDANVSEQNSSDPAAETREEFPVVERKNESMDNVQNDDSATKQFPHTVVAGGDGMGSSDVAEEAVLDPSSPDHSLASDAFAVIGKTQLEEDSEKREADKEATKKKDDSDFKVTSAVEGEVPLDKQATSEKPEESQSEFASSPEKVAVSKELADEKVAKRMKDDEQISSEKSKSNVESLNERVADRIRKRREEREQQKSSRSTRPYDSRSKIEPGKVSSARSRFDTSNQSASPRTSRARATTDLSTERKLKSSPGGSDGTSPSWLSDLQKRKEQKIDRTKDKTASGKEDKVEDMPDWRKRVHERRKKAAEGSKVSSSTASPKLGRRHETDKVSARTDKPLRRDLRSNVRKSPSPSATRKSARSTKEEKSEIVSKKGDVISKSDAQEETDSKEEMNPTRVEEDTLVSKDTDPTEHESSEKDSETKTEVTSPKPEITSPKPKIEFVSRKVIKKSGSIEHTEEKSDVTPSETATNDGKDKNATEEGLAADTKEEQSLASKGRSPSPQSPSNLSSQVLADSQESQPSSTSSEKEGVPFRSRNMSHSRSPTPTSHTPGPLKLPADPEIPEWKKKVLERKKNPTSPKQSEPTSKKSEPVVPAWKKELLAKRTKTGEEVWITYICQMFQLVIIHHKAH